jgi:hypothetical protein
MSRAGLAYAEAILDEDEALGAYVDWALSLVDARQGSRALVGTRR